MKHPKCSVEYCHREDEYCAMYGKCIFHYDKRDWYKATAAGMRDWSESKLKVESFWIAIHEQIDKVKKSKDGSYNFAGYVFPHFWTHDFHKSYSSSEQMLFDSDVHCVGATFLAQARFSDMQFKSLVRFEGSVFEEGADFSFVEFMHEANFSRCKFLGETSFRVIFHEKAHFNDTQFAREKRTIFGPYALGKNYSVFRDTAYFWNIDFPRSFIFSHIDFTYVTFSKSNIEEVQFSECTFEKIKGRIRLFDEKGIYREGGYNVIASTYFGIMENVYRQFKRNFESKRDWSRVSEFFIGEMEMRRTRLRLEANGRGIPREEYLKEPSHFLGIRWWKNLCQYPPKINTFHWWKLALSRFFLEIFRSVSFYGQREVKAFLVLLGLVLVGAFFLWLTGYSSAYSILTSMRAISFQQEDHFDKLPCAAQWVITLLRVGAAILLPLFALALRNRFKR